jgi:hypothetical protein
MIATASAVGRCSGSIRMVCPGCGRSIWAERRDIDPPDAVEIEYKCRDQHGPPGAVPIYRDPFGREVFL